MVFSLCCTEKNPHSHSEQLLNHIVDCIAATKPKTIYAEFPISPASYQTGCLEVTYGRLSNSINRIAWWLYDTIGQGKNFETLAYIGPNDLTYPSLILGAVKAGYKILLLSPHNSVDAQLHLLKATNCKTILLPQSRQPPSKPILATVEGGLSVLELPTVDELLRPGCRAFQYTKTLEEARWHPLVVLQTSGSTSPPRPITWVQGFASAYAKQLQLNPPAGYESAHHCLLGKRVSILFPHFDAIYVAHGLINAICSQAITITPVGGNISWEKSLLQTIKYTTVDVAVVVPIVIEQLSKSLDHLARVSSKVKFLAYSGGGIPDECGNIVAKQIFLTNFYSITEGASIALTRKLGANSREDWKYLRFHPKSGAQFRHYVEDIHELFIIRARKLEHQHQIFTTLPGVSEYRTNDLFIKHPLKHDLWRHVGRADDVVVLSTGEKIHTADMEQNILSCNSDITGALIAGSQKQQVSLLLEMAIRTRVTPFQKAEDIARIWPSIEQVNKACPPYARIAKTHIIITEARRPFPRSQKGTIWRAEALAEYSKEINTLYADANEVHITGKPTSLINRRGMVALSEYLRKRVAQITGKRFEDDENFFVGGIDSLQVLQLSRDLNTALLIPGLGVGIIYDNPFISALAETLQQITIDGPNSTSSHNKNAHRRGRINALLRKYKALVDGVAPWVLSDQPKENGHATMNRVAKIEQNFVLLTGSTSALGSYILHWLLATANVVHIYCLNETPGGLQSQKLHNKARALTTDFPTSRVTLLTADFSKVHFGFEREVYLPLLNKVTNIVHSAWPVNLTAPVSAFHPPLLGVINLISFAASGLQHPQILFTSSVDAVARFKGLNVPEEIIYDSSAPAAVGYSESKYLAERILHYSSRRLSIKTNIARLGHIAGPMNGNTEWNKNVGSSIIKSSHYIGTMPKSLGPSLDAISWIPIDIAARALLDLMGPAKLNYISGSGAVVYNVLNPHPVSWEILLPIINQNSSSGRKNPPGKTILTVPFDVWISQVRNSMKTIDGDQGNELESFLNINPALKLVHFYEDAMKRERIDWAMDNTKNTSGTLRDLEAIKGLSMRKWVQSWLG